MSGLAYAGSMQVSEPLPARWVSVVVLSALIHLLPMLCLTLSGHPLADREALISVDFSDVPDDPAPARKNPAPDAPVIEPPPLPPAIAAKNTDSPPARPPAPPPAPPAAAPKEPKLDLPKVAAAKQPAAPEPAKPLNLREPELPALNPKDMAAFDESKITKEIPKDGYASDRTSTAADRGPKNLPRGDPFIDKGESKVIRYMERRGEGNLPAFAASASSGSIKKEGNPQAGHGALVDERPPDLKMPPKSPIRADEVDPRAKPSEKTAASQLAEGPKATRPVPAQTKPAHEDQAAEKKLGLEKTDNGQEPAAQSPKPLPADQSASFEAVNTTPPAAEKPSPNPPPDGALVSEKDAPRRNVSSDELDAFRAQLDGLGKKEGRGGEYGQKTGLLARPGEKGHEGDGTLRPGHDEAVSDVTTINLDSSAEEFDNARFAKKFDPKVAYVKPLARRIDNKWKAEIVARNRFRLVRGIVSIRIVVQRDGKLLDASEVTPRAPGVTDECVAIAKLAVQRAADPASEPFPPELRNHETLEFVFNFLY